MSEATPRKLSEASTQKIRLAKVGLTRAMFLNQHEEPGFNRELVLTRLANNINSMQLSKEEWTALAEESYTHYEQTAVREKRQAAIDSLIAYGYSETDAIKAVDGKKAK